MCNTLVRTLDEKPSLYEIKNARIFGIIGVIIGTVVGLLRAVTGNVWIKPVPADAPKLKGRERSGTLELAYEFSGMFDNTL